MIVCNTCKNEYEALFESTDQGIDCSAEANEEGVVGYYGSTLLDLEKWKWTTGKPIHVMHGIMCDTCIRPLIQSGALIFNTSYW